MVDCSHAHSAKQHARQETCAHVIEQRAERRSIIGVMLEVISTKLPPFPETAAGIDLRISITDACLGWESHRTDAPLGKEKLSSRAEELVTT